MLKGFLLQGTQGHVIKWYMYFYYWPVFDKCEEKNILSASKENCCFYGVVKNVLFQVICKL